MQASVYSTDGKKAGSIELPENVFAVRWNGDLVKQVVDSLTSSKRKSIAHTKTRGEVRGGGRKPWRQKGTGRARHGSTRSPIWVGGGVTHGPRNDKNYERKVSKKMRVKALYAILSKKLSDGEVLFLDKISPIEVKTREGVKILKNIATIEGFEGIASKKKNALAIALAKKERGAERIFSNIGKVEVLEARNLNPLTILQYKYLMFENPDISTKSIPKIKNV